MKHHPRAWLDEARDQIEQRRLATAAGSEQYEKLPTKYLEIDGSQRGDFTAVRATPEPLCNVANGYVNIVLPDHGSGSPTFQGISRRSSQSMPAFMTKPMMPIVIIPVSTTWVCSSIRLC